MAKERTPRKQKSPPKRRFVEPGTELLTWKVPKHETVLIKGGLNRAALERDAQRLASELGPDHPRVKMLRQQLDDLAKGHVVKVATNRRA